MARTDPLLDFIRQFKEPDTSRLGDAELLARFVANQDKGIFKSIVRRHGPMVLQVCRGVLQRNEDVEDAFQATFMALVNLPDRFVSCSVAGCIRSLTTSHGPRAGAVSAGNPMRPKLPCAPNANPLDRVDGA